MVYAVPQPGGGPISLTTTLRRPASRAGRGLSHFLAKYYARHAAMVAQTETCLRRPDHRPHPNVRDAWACRPRA